MDWASLSAELGVARDLSASTRFSLGVSRRGLDRTGAESFWQLRSGLSSGGFWRVLETPLFAETYGEGFVFAAPDTKTFFTANAWAKAGYRAYERHHLILDPAVFELRGASNSAHDLAGPNYLAANFGPRLTVWFSEPAVQASLFVSRSWILSASREYEVRPYWFLLSAGGAF